MKRVLYFYRNDGWNSSCWRVGPSNQVESYGRTLETAVNALLFQGSTGRLPVYVTHDDRPEEFVGTVDLAKDAAVCRIEPAAIAAEPDIFWPDVHETARDWDKNRTCGNCGQVSPYPLRFLEWDGTLWSEPDYPRRPGPRGKGEHHCRRCAPRDGDQGHQCPGCAPREVEAADDLGGEAAWEHMDPAHRLTMARSQQIKRGE